MIPNEKSWGAWILKIFAVEVKISNILLKKWVHLYVFSIVIYGNKLEKKFRLKCIFIKIIIIIWVVWGPKFCLKMKLKSFAILFCSTVFYICIRSPGGAINSMFGPLCVKRIRRNGTGSTNSPTIRFAAHAYQVSIIERTPTSVILTDNWRKCYGQCRTSYVGPSKVNY